MHRLSVGNQKQRKSHTYSRHNRIRVRQDDGGRIACTEAAPAHSFSSEDIRYRRWNVNVLVKGAGVAGLTTAWELQRRGARTTVTDRQKRVGGLASWYAGGMLAPSEPD